MTFWGRSRFRLLAGISYKVVVLRLYYRRSDLAAAIQMYGLLNHSLRMGTYTPYKQSGDQREFKKACLSPVEGSVQPCPE